MKNEQTALLTLEKTLETRVAGQPAALNAIAQRLRASKTGLTAENGPLGVFLLVGTSGTGKTETALALADTLYGGEKSLIDPTDESGCSVRPDAAPRYAASAGDAGCSRR